MRIPPLLLVSLLITGCGDTDREYLPLPTAATLTYALTETTSGNTRRQKQLTTIRGPLTVDDKKVYQQFTAVGPQRLLQENANGIVEIAYYQSTDPVYHDDAVMVLPRPLQAGSRWRAPVTTRLLEWRKHVLENAGRRFRHPLTADYHCETLSDRVETPAGTFSNVASINVSASKTIEYGSIQEQTVIHVEMTLWYAPGIGLIKSKRRESADSRELNPGDSTMILERID